MFEKNEFPYDGQEMKEMKSETITDITPEEEEEINTMLAQSNNDMTRKDAEAIIAAKRNQEGNK